MSSQKVYYREGYKYQLAEEYREFIPIYPPRDIKTEWIELSPAGYLRIKRNYAWDGPSGPTIDTKSSIRGSLKHDALYQLIEMGSLPESYRELADKELKNTCLEDGMLHLRAELWEDAVRLFGASHAKVGCGNPVLVAP